MQPAPAIPANGHRSSAKSGSERKSRHRSGIPIPVCRIFHGPSWPRATRSRTGICRAHLCHCAAFWIAANDGATLLRRRRTKVKAPHLRTQCTHPSETCTGHHNQALVHIFVPQNQRDPGRFRSKAERPQPATICGLDTRRAAGPRGRAAAQCAGCPGVRRAAGNPGPW